MSEYAVRSGEAQQKASGKAQPPPAASRAARSRSGKPGPDDIISGKDATKDFDGF